MSPENKMYLHIWPPGPLVPTWSWHSVHTSEALERYGPTTERRGGQWQIFVMKSNDKTEREERVVAAIYSTDTPSSSLTGQKTCRCCHLKWGRGGGLSVCVEGNCCSNRPSNWQYWGDSKQGEALPSCRSRIWHFTRVKGQVVREICYGNIRGLPCSATAQPVREASGSKSKPQLSLFLCIKSVAHTESQAILYRIPSIWCA